MKLVRALPLILLPLAAGCATGVKGPVLSASEFEQRYPASVSVLAPGDRIKVALYGDDAMSGEYDVAADGTVSLPLVGITPAVGLTPEGLRQALESKLSVGLYKNPRISVQVVSLLPVYVLGEVRKPGAFPYVPDMTLSKAAALAEGYTYRADMNVVAIRRARTQSEVLVTSDQSIPLAPGDTVRVLERYF